MTGTFVTIGNMERRFDRFFVALDECWELLPSPVVVQKGRYSYSLPTTTLYDFIEPTAHSKLMESSDLIVTHAGVGSIISANRAGKIPLVMPRLATFLEHVNDHQLYYAESMNACGRAHIFQNAKDLRAHFLSGASFVKDYSNTAQSHNEISEVLEQIRQTSVR